jgi:Carbon starvation protein CstA
MGTITDTTGWQTKILWIGVAVLGAVSFGIVALNRGEAVNAAWLVVAAVCVYFVAYRFYGLFVANWALGVDGTRPTPAVGHNDGLDYVPTNRYVLYGHHFAAIAGAGPLVGPVLAAQMGYLPVVVVDNENCWSIGFHQGPLASLSTVRSCVTAVRRIAAHIRGQTTAAPPRKVMNSRRIIRSLRRRATQRGHPREANVVSISSILALAGGHQYVADLLVTGGKIALPPPDCESRTPCR